MLPALTQLWPASCRCCCSDERLSMSSMLLARRRSCLRPLLDQPALSKHSWLLVLT